MNQYATCMSLVLIFVFFRSTNGSADLCGPWRGFCTSYGGWWYSGYRQRLWWSIHTWRPIRRYRRLNYAVESDTTISDSASEISVLDTDNVLGDIVPLGALAGDTQQTEDSVVGPGGGTVTNATIRRGVTVSGTVNVNASSQIEGIAVGMISTEGGKADTE